VAEYSSTVRDGVANPVPAYLRYRVTSGARTPSDLGAQSDLIAAPEWVSTEAVLAAPIGTVRVLVSPPVSLSVMPEW
jgi:hypothetical protein